METDNRETDKILTNLHSLSIYIVASIMIFNVVVVVVVVEGSLVPSMRETGTEGHYKVNH